MRLDLDGHLMYANPASAGVLRAIGTGVGERVPAEILARCREAAAARGFFELRSDNRTYAVWPVLDRGPGLHEPVRHGRHGRAGDREVPGPEPEPGPADRLERPPRLRQPGERRAHRRPGSRTRGRAGGRASRCAAGPRPRCGPRSPRGRGRRSNLRAAAGRCPRVRLRERLRHGRDGGQGAGAARRARTSASCSTSCPRRSPSACATGSRSSRTASTTSRCCSPTWSSSPACRRRCRRPSWSASSTRCSRCSTGSSIATTWRR